MKRAVVDASALLAVLQQEPGHEQVAHLILGENTEALVSAVNLSEVVAVLRDRGVSPAEGRQLLGDLALTIISFDAEQARSAGNLIEQTKRYGLSLGDRACLALGLQQRCKVITVDRVWAKLDIRLDIEVAR